MIRNSTRNKRKQLRLDEKANQIMEVLGWPEWAGEDGVEWQLPISEEDFNVIVDVLCEDPYDLSDFGANYVDAPNCVHIFHRHDKYDKCFDLVKENDNKWTLAYQTCDEFCYILKYDASSIEEAIRKWEWFK